MHQEMNKRRSIQRTQPDPAGAMNRVWQSVSTKNAGKGAKGKGKGKGVSPPSTPRILPLSLPRPPIRVDQKGRV